MQISRDSGSGTRNCCRHRIRIISTLSERTIAEELHEAGYATFFAGKWHLGSDGFLPTDQGFDENKGGSNAGSPRSYFSPYRNRFLPDGPAGRIAHAAIG